MDADGRTLRDQRRRGQEHGKQSGVESHAAHYNLRIRKKRRGRAALIAALILTLAASSISGVVHDSSGGVVSGAAVIIRVESGSEQRVTTGPDGRFSVDVAEARDVTVIVRAGGFAEKQERVTDVARPLQIVLAPAQLLEQVTVTASRTEQRLGDIPASINVLHAEEIRMSPAVVADDVLRQIPTFSLFRRTSSLSSHPTAQGVSLRGIGPSGVSRTLVLVDGAPFNDPFGGWVYWTRVPLESVDRIEVVDGSSSSLYGNYAMGGVINIVTSRATRRTLELKPQYGNHDSPKLDYFASDVWGKVGVTVDGSLFNTDGFPIVAPAERGIIDNNATVKFQNFNGKVDYRPTDRLQAFFRAGYFSEDRGNGKILEVNDTRWTSASGGVRIRMPDESDLQVSVNGDFETFHSTFFAVTPPSATVAPRSIVRLTVDQVVPTNAVAASSSGRRRSAPSSISAPAPTGTGWMATARRMATTPAPGPVVPPVQNAVLALKRVSGGNAAQHRRVRPGHPDAAPEPDGDAQRAHRSVAELRRAQPRGQRAVGHADREQPAAAGSRRHRLQPAHRRDVPPDRAGQHLGGHQLRASARRRSTSCIASSASAPC